MLESRSEEYVASRIRAGILEQSTVDLLREVGLGDRLEREGARAPRHLPAVAARAPPPRLRRPHRSLGHRLRPDRGAEGPGRRARTAAGQRSHYEIGDTALHDLETDEPSVTFTDADGRRSRLRADVVVGCDGSFGPSRAAVPDAARTTWERTYPYSWLGILADVAPSTDELIYAWHPDGFALHSMRSAHGQPALPAGAQRHRRRRLVRRPDLGRRWRPGSATARTAGTLTPGPITEKSVLPMRSFVQTPMRHGRLFLAGDAAHIVPPTGAKGLNLAVADVALLAPALAAWLRDGRRRASPTRYADTALRRVWRCTHFSWWMTTMLHTTGDAVRRPAAALPAALGHLQPGRRHRAGRELRRAADRLLTRPRRTLARM